jgi:hypothetical protein
MTFPRILLGIGAALALASLDRLHADESGVWTIVNDNDPAASYSSGMEKCWFDGSYHIDSYPTQNAGVLFGGSYHTETHMTEKVGEWASFSFVGTGVKWIGAQNHDHGRADVFIDGNFDSTASSVGPTWTTQQDIYTKTGLPFGPHTMKIVVKTPNCEDFAAFAFLGPAPRVATMPAIEGVTLPPLQPLLNVPTRYAIGNGVAVAVCGPAGQIETVFGPGYTTSDFMKHEDIFINLDNIEMPLRIDMKRAAGTGVFYGVASRGDIDVGIVDYACKGEPWLSRLILLKNSSATASHTVIVRDSIAPHTDNGYKSGVAMDAAGNHAAFTVQADTSTGVPFGGSNPVDKSVVIAFNDPASTASAAGDNDSLQTKSIPLAPGAQHELSLTHYFRAGHDLTDDKAIDALRAIAPHETLLKSIGDWKKWIDHLAPAYALSNIKDPRARVLMEGALIVLKTNQSQDGGVIAHTTYYKEGYIRDAAMAVRGLLAAGHTDEAKQWLIWIDKRLSIHHHLGDAMSCSVSLDDKSSSFDMGNMRVEGPGWVLLCARDYYEQTHDLAFLKSIDSTLRYCAEIQLKDAMANDYKLEFNGDETEICGALNIEATGFVATGNAQQKWALSSVAMAAASVDFFSDYVKASGGDPANYHDGQTNTTIDLNAQVKKLVAAMDRDFWRTDVAESPGGFHDFYRVKADGAWPKARLVNFTLMPAFFGTPYPMEEKEKDVAAMAQLFDQRTGFLQLVPISANGMEGHDLGYLLWDCVETGDWHKDMVYHALVDGPTADCWGAFSEALSSDGHPNDHDLRSLETGVNVSALAKYWGLGK